jgi:very-short-patch-repair endonuclease
MNEPSPIEQQFWQAWKRLRSNIKLTPEYPVGRYRIDFAYVPAKIAIELDGHATHSTPSAIAADRRRQRELERLGWRFIRFGGQEIYQDADACAREAREFIVKHSKKAVHEQGPAAQPVSLLGRIAEFLGKLS